MRLLTDGVGEWIYNLNNLKQQQMKKLIVILLFIITAMTAKAQIEPFVDFGVHSYGVNFQAGIVIERAEIIIGYSPTFYDVTLPSTTTILVGGFIPFGNFDSEWRLTGSAGISWYSLSNDGTKDDIIIVNEGIAPAFKLKLGKEMHAGQVYGYVSQFKELTYGLGLMVYPFRL